jgi:hypothetical protein
MSRHPHKIITCLNCGEKFSGKFCNECGQKAEVERLTGRHLLSEVIHAITHYEKGFLHTVWVFLVRPGNASLRFLEGKRKEYQKPVSYILILTGLYILLHNYIISRFGYTYELWSNSSIMTNDANIFLRTHFTPFIFMIIVVSACVIYLVLGKGIFNFIETLVLCLYGGGTYFMMLTLSDIVLGAVFGVNIISMNVFLYQTILSSAYNLWFSYDIFKKARVNFLWPRLIIVSILVSVIGYCMMTYLPLLLM